MSYEYEIIRSERKTVAIEITPDLRVTVRAPRNMAEREIRRVVSEKSDWIDKTVERIRVKNAHSQISPTKLSEAELAAVKRDASVLITERVRYFAPLVGVEYNRICIKSMVSRWGSCSSKRNLNFSCLLALCPSEVLDYVVVHELCHLIEFNHSARFWREVERILPDCKSRRAWLRENSALLTAKIK